MAGRRSSRPDRNLRLGLGTVFAGTAATIAGGLLTSSNNGGLHHLFHTAGFDSTLFALVIGLVLLISTMPRFSEPAFKIYCYSGTAVDHRFQRQYLPSEEDRVLVRAVAIEDVERYITMIRVKETRYRAADKVSFEVISVTPPHETYENTLERLAWEGPDFTTQYVSFSPGGARFAIINMVTVNTKVPNRSTHNSLTTSTPCNAILAIVWDGKLLSAYEFKIEWGLLPSSPFAQVSFIRNVAISEVRQMQKAIDKTWT